MTNLFGIFSKKSFGTRPSENIAPSVFFVDGNVCMVFEYAEFLIRTIRSVYNGFSGRKSRGEQPRNLAISLMWFKLYFEGLFGFSTWLMNPSLTPMPYAKVACDIC